MAGLINGRLHPPPAKPNCVSSEAERGSPHHIEPFDFTGRPEFAQKKIKRVLEDFPRVELAMEGENYLHYVFTSAVFRWKDDVEFRIDPFSGKVHFRSASRVGYSDLGANRRRMEQIRAAWQAWTDWADPSKPSR